MTLYKVLKDFPSMRGGTEYITGETVRLCENNRTAGLIQMGYIKLYHTDDNYAGIIEDQLLSSGNFKNIDVVPTMTAGKHKYFNIHIEEKM